MHFLPMQREVIFCALLKSNDPQHPLIQRDWRGMVRDEEIDSEISGLSA
jgi:hypothetical protein